jgi:hypothetical protein
LHLLKKRGLFKVHYFLINKRNNNQKNQFIETMKKTSLLLVMLTMLFSGVKAQFSENFNAVAIGAMPAGWTVFNVDGHTPNSSVNWVTNAWVCAPNQALPTQAAWSTSWYTPAGTSNDWMFTPAIVVPAITPILRYTVLASDANFLDGYELRIMTTAPTSANLTTSTVLLSVPQAAATATVKTIDLTDYAGQTVYIGWRNNSSDMNVLGVDDVKVRSNLGDDITAVSINTASMVLVGNSNITGTVSNSGSNNITSYDVTYKIDGGTSSAVYSVTGVTIAPGATANFTHNVPATLVSGNHTLEIQISNVNGVVDPYSEDNAITKTISVASQTVSKMLLLEGFSSSTCSPCASWNSVFNPWAVTNDANMNFIKYQVDFPGSGDPYYIQQTGDREAYYNVSSAPDFYGDGAELTLTGAPGLTTAVNQEASKYAVFGIVSTPTYTGNVITVPVTINPYITMSGLTLHVVVCEKKTTGNIGSNGETEWHHVMMQMLPSSAGTTINFTDGTPYTNTLTKDMTGTHVEEMSDLVAVVFIQDNATKEVLQSKTFNISLFQGIENIAANDVKVFPNPASDIVHIANAANSNIVVCDVLGKVVISESSITNDFNLNVSALAKGNYVLKIMNGNQVVTQKIAILK